MCGIIGQFSFEPQPSETSQTLQALNQRAFLRGPDDAGFWTDDQHCALAFRRLSILDLSPAGRQPMLTPDGRFAIVLNGEIYNFPDLRQQLIARGWSFRSTGDAEVALLALAQWGRPALERFNGIFALAFYDCQEKKLLLARDHAGSKPLYYLLSREGLLFGSQYDQIMSHPWAKDQKVDQNALALYLRFGYIPAPYAILSNTFLLEAGSWLELDLSCQPVTGRFFEFPQFQQPDLSGPEAFEAVASALVSAVKRQMVSDVPLGCFLSGGIDSPLIASIAQSLTSQPLKAFTIGVKDSPLDESADAAAYAKEIGVEHQLEYIDFAAVPSLVAQVSQACSEPFGDYSIFPTLLLSRFASQQVKVMLSGDGGDELFWGYTGRMGNAVRFAPRFQQPFWLRKLRWHLLRRPEDWNLRYFKAPGRWYQSTHEHNFEGWLTGLFPDIASFPPGYHQYDFSGTAQDETAQWVRWNEYTGHMGNGMLKVDRGSMFHSLEVRTPLLDREVIAAALRVDWRSCLDLASNTGKLPLRAALADRLSHQSQGKRGFTVPMGEWLRGPLRPLFEDLVIASGSLLGLPFDRQKLSAIFQEHLIGKVNRDWGFWIFLSLALWEDSHYRSIASSS